MIVPKDRNDKLVRGARQLIAASRGGLDDRGYVEQTLAALNRSNKILSAMRHRAFDDLFPAELDRQQHVQRDPGAEGAQGIASDPGVAEPSASAAPAKPLSVSQRRGMARKIAAYLKRSGLDLRLIDDGVTPPRGLRN